MMCLQAKGQQGSPTPPEPGEEPGTTTPSASRRGPAHCGMTPFKAEKEYIPRASLCLNLIIRPGPTSVHWELM